MRILGISDVEEDWLTTYYDHERMRDVDLIISCGDLPARYLEHIVTLANVPLLYVPGNHDTDYARHQPEGCISIEGGIRSFRGLHIMGLGGSLKYNGTVYGFSEQEMRWRAAKMSLLAQSTGGVDILVTHAPIRGFADARPSIRSWSVCARASCCTGTFTWHMAAWRARAPIL